MIEANLQWAAEATKGALSGDASRPFRGVSTDTRDLRPGQLFFCLVAQRDGHEFAAQALKQGAAAVVIDESHRDLPRQFPSDAAVLIVPDTLRALGDLAHAWRKKFSIPVLAITGSNGKTTTKELIKAILKTRYRVLATEGNLNNLIGVPKTLFQLSPEDQVAVIEMGMNDFGEIARLAEIAAPTMGLITNIGAAHLEKLGGIEGVTTAKGELFAALPADAIAFVNAADPNVAKLKTAARRISYAGPDSGVQGEISPQPPDDERPLHLQIRDGAESFSLSMKLPGFHNLTNVLAALSVGRELSVPSSEAKRALENFTLSASRMELLRLKSGIRLIDDCYNANPSSTAAALHTLSRLKGKSKALAILGEMLELGGVTAQEHRKIGQVAAQEGIDFLVSIGPHAAAMREGAREKGMPETRLSTFVSTEDAVGALAHLPAGVEWVLVKGSRGMHLEKIVHHLKERY